MNIRFNPVLSTVLPTESLITVGSSGKSVSYSNVKTGRLTIIRNKQTAWQSLNTRFLALQDAAAGAQTDANWIFRTSRLPTDAFGVVTDATAVPGTYKVSVDRMAQFQRISSDFFHDLYGPLGMNGTLVVGILEVPVTADDSLSDIGKYFTAINNATVVSDEQDPAYASAGGTVGVNSQDITVPAGAGLADIRDLINANVTAGAWAAVSSNRLYLGASDGSAVTVRDAAGTVLAGLGMLNPENRSAEPLSEDVSATVTGGRLYLARNQSTAQLALSGDEALWQELGFLDETGELKNETTAPQTALVTVDGRTYERGTNTISDILNGISLTLKRTSGIARNLTVTEDSGAPRSLIENFIEQYNLAVTEINGFLTDDGLFRLDPTVWGIRDEMVSTFREPVAGVEPSLNTADAAGIMLKEKPVSIITDFPTQRSTGADDTSTDETLARLQDEGHILHRLNDIGIVYDETWGTLQIDQERLTTALNTEPEATMDLFTRGSDGLAGRVRAQMEQLTGTPVGTVAGQLNILELTRDQIESTGQEEYQAGVFDGSNTREAYLNLLYVRNLMAMQKESYLNTTSYGFLG